MGYCSCFHQRTLSQQNHRHLSTANENVAGERTSSDAVLLVSGYQLLALCLDSTAQTALLQTSNEYASANPFSSLHIHGMPSRMRKRKGKRPLSVSSECDDDWSHEEKKPAVGVSLLSQRKHAMSCTATIATSNLANLNSSAYVPSQ